MGKRTPVCGSRPEWIWSRWRGVWICTYIQLRTHCTHQMCTACACQRKSISLHWVPNDGCGSQVMINYLKRTNSKTAQSFLEELWRFKTRIPELGEDIPIWWLMSAHWSECSGIFSRSPNILTYNQSNTGPLARVKFLQVESLQLLLWVISRHRLTPTNIAFDYKTQQLGSVGNNNYLSN